MKNPIETPQPKSNRNIIIAVVVIISLCCCVVTVAAGCYGYQAYVAAQAALEQFEDFEIPTGIPSDPNNPDSSTISLPGFDSRDVPQGGLTDDSTRVVAWSTAQIFAAIQGCASPTADGTMISVTQQPDSNGVWNGVWMEEWAVSCGDGTSQSLDITFAPENDIVSVSIEFKYNDGAGRRFIFRLLHSLRPI